jgi:uncharacterized membrane protein (DUF485 family)
MALAAKIVLAKETEAHAQSLTILYSLYFIRLFVLVPALIAFASLCFGVTGIGW